MNFNLKFSKNIVNPIYRDAFDTDADIVIFWGGRDAGRSTAASRIFIYHLFADPGFKGILIRDYYNAIKDSQYSKINTYLDQAKLKHLVKATKSPLEFVTISGAQILARGCDNIDSIKSIDDPTVAWIEEANKVKEEYWDVIKTTMRNPHGKTKVILTLNPEADHVDKYEDHWIYKLLEPIIKKYGEDTYRSVKTHTTEIEVDGEMVSKKIMSVHATIDDNPFATIERKAEYIRYKHKNNYRYTTWYLGKWSNKMVEDPFFFSFSEDKHVSNLVEINEWLPLLFAFDFNMDPTTCIVFQYDLPNIWVWDCVQAKGGTKVLCDILKDEYADHPAGIEATGDNSGYAASSVGGLKNGAAITDFEVIKETLNLSPYDIKRPSRVNPKHTTSRKIINYAFDHLNIKIHTRCKALIEDLLNGQVDNKGRLVKDREANKQDAGDAFRYGIHNILPRGIKTINQYIEQEHVS